jgi:Tfp pilus assembly protein PilP
VQPQRRKRNSSIIPWVLALFIGLAFYPGLTAAQFEQKKIVEVEKEKHAIPQSEPSQEMSEKALAEGAAAEEKKPYSYDPTNKPDPFKSFIIVKKELDKEKEKEEPRTYLETLDISQLTLTAIAISKDKKWALVQDSKGEGHVISVGTPIGIKRGTVIDIREKEVVVREHDRDYRGNEVINNISLKLPEAD